MMNGTFTVEKINRNSVDIVLLAALILLIGIGLSVLFSSSYYYSELKFGEPTFFFKKQIVKVLIGIVLIIFVLKTPVSFLRKLAPILILFSLILTSLTFVPGIGREILGARRWLFLFGYSFQPSEIVKASLIFYFSYILSKKSERINDFVYTLLPLFIVTLTFVTLIYLQNDFSTAFFIFFIAVVMLFVAGLKIFYFVFISAVGIPAAFILLFTKEHRVKRLIAFLNPQIDPIGAGYQVNMARSALIGGGLWGTGVGEGTIKLGALPEAHSDFVFAVLGEEMGFLGVMFVLGILITFAVRGYTIAAKSSDQFNSILAFGITTTIFYQALLNIGVVSGLVPATGIPLPFFSLGGSSIVVTLFMYGVLLNLSRHINEGGVSE